MNKLIVSFVFAFSFLVSAPAFAQTYATGCVNIPSGLGLGAQSGDVSSLQRFLVSQNYPGGGSWMVTGYFGAATQAALRNFQQQQGLPQSGSVDAATASAIARVSCGGVSVSYPISYPVTYPTIPTTYPSYYSYPSYLSYYGTTPTITSLSQNTGSPGTSVTVYGVGFDPYNNTVNFGGTQLSGIASNGNSLTFTIPSSVYSYSPSGTAIQLTISNSRGTSNSVSFTVWGSPYTCGYGYSYGCGGCSYPYNGGYYGSYYQNNSYCYPQTSTPSIAYLSPTSGGVGTTVVVYGSGFSASGNSVHFGPGVIANLLSSDGRTLSFTVPSYLSGYGSQPVTLSTYQVSVVNAYGVQSNQVPFTVTSTGASNQPVIQSVTGPTSLSVGQQGVWTVNVGSWSGQYLTFSADWGDNYVYGATPASQYPLQQTSTLTHTYYSSGTYTIRFTVTNSSGQQNSYTTTVVVGGSSQYGAPSISYLSPNAARVGQQVTIFGSGFMQNNTITFGQGAIQNAYSGNGSSITFTVPSYVGPYCPSGSACPAYAIQITPGTYNVSVTNQNGTSNTVQLTVQQ
jgi:hypothetical protein